MLPFPLTADFQTLTLVHCSRLLKICVSSMRRDGDGGEAGVGDVPRRPFGADERQPDGTTMHPPVLAEGLHESGDNCRAAVWSADACGPCGGASRGGGF